MSLLRVFLFGRFEVRRADEVLTGFEARKVQELFCYLLLYPDHPHPRESLAHLLWDERQTDWPSRCLRKTLWQLRSTLDAQEEPLSDRILLVESDWVQVNPEADLWLDTAKFEHAFQRAQALPANQLDVESAQDLRDAVALYRVGLQESWYEDWYLYERERFQHMYLVMLDKLMGYCEAHGDYDMGLYFGTLILRCERARERTHRRLMRLYHLAGDRTAALRQYVHCVRALDEELGVQPARRTVALYRQISTDQLNRPSLAQFDAANRPRRSPPSRFLIRLRQLQAVLADVQQEIARDIHELESALSTADPPVHSE